MQVGKITGIGLCKHGGILHFQLKCIFQVRKAYRHHSDYVDIDMFFKFLKVINGSISQIDCMIEAKRKDEALFKLTEEVKTREDVDLIDGSSFRLK